MVNVVGGNEIESENESSKPLSLCVSADDSGENCEEINGCVVLDYALIFKE
jgi:hypothetical protein